MNRIIRGSALCALALIFSIPALAVTGHRGVTASKDGRVTIANSPVPGVAPVVDFTDGTDAVKTIYNNISKYPLGRYWCCSGWTISGPNSPIGDDIAVGTPFTAPADGTVTRIVVGVGFVTGTNGVTVSLNSDASGLPGTSLGSFDHTGLPVFGSCCTVVVSNTGIPITKGSQYWVVVSTGPDTMTTWDAWNNNDTNQTAQPFASRNNGVWQASSGILGAMAVQGTKP